MRGSALVVLALLLAAWPTHAQVPLLPDLVVVNPAISPAAPRDGDDVTFNVTLVNQGLGPAPNARVLLMLDGFPLETTGPYDLAPGERVNVSNGRAWVAVPGPHQFRALADPGNLVLESDETNNDVRLDFVVAHLPDLRIASFTLSPQAPRAGDAVTFTAVLDNSGESDAGLFHARIVLDGAELVNTSYPGLAAGQQVNLTASWTAQQGSHVVQAEVDVGHEVAESNEANNEASFPFSVAPPVARADLVVADLRWSPTLPTHGQMVSFQALVRNSGAADAGATATRFFVDDGDIGTVATPALAAGTDAWVTAPAWQAVAGTHTVRAEADVAQQVEESDEADNARSETFQVAPAAGLPDLVVEQFTLHPAPANEGQTLSLTARVRNGGGLPAGPFRVDFRLDGRALGNVAVAGLAGGGVVEVTSPPWTATGGEHMALAIADAGAQVTETDEGNNQATLDFSVGAAQPNLVVDSLRSQPAAPAPGQSVTFQAMVRDAGTASVGPFRVSFRVDGAEVGNVTVAGLAASGSLLVESPPWQARQGARLARAIADASNQVVETSEDDNEATLALPSLSALPNLVVEQLTASPERPAPGEEVRLSAVVANLGSAASGATDVLFKLGSASVLADLPALEVGGRASISSAPLTFRGASDARAVADAARRVAELSEDDNTRVLRVEAGASEPIVATSIPAGPILGAVTITPLDPAPGDVVRARVQVNAGGAASTDLATRLLVDGVEVDRASLGSLQPASLVNASLAWRASPGTHTLRIDLLRGSEVLASAPPRTLTVATQATSDLGALPVIVVLALLVIGLAALGMRGAGKAR